MPFKNKPEPGIIFLKNKTVQIRKDISQKTISSKGLFKINLYWEVPEIIFFENKPEPVITYFENLHQLGHWSRINICTRVPGRTLLRNKKDKYEFYTK